MINKFLPTSLKELQDREWDYIDIILVSGDAYIDHPSFGIAVIGRVLENQGFRVAILPQPNWRDDLRDFKKLGKPRLFFGITAGNMDSMINKYTANKRLRHEDAYSPDGRSDLRPEYATTTYCEILKQLYPDVPLVIGGIEASMRRFTHYDYWQEKLYPSILIPTKADFLVYGMGEKPIIEIATKLAQQQPHTEIQQQVSQIAYLTQQTPSAKLGTSQIMYSYEECLQSKKCFMENFKTIEANANSHSNNLLIEPYQNSFIVVNPVVEQTTEELDKIYTLPYTREPHPRYKGKSIKAFTMIQNSVQLHRGCFGGCSFCAIAMHQGKHIVSRSPKNILQEIEKITSMPYFKGILSDLGGPTANMYRMTGKNLAMCQKCKRPACIHPTICKNLNISHKDILDLYERVRKVNKVKKAFIGSGIRYDLFLDESGFFDSHANQYFKTLLKHHVSGRLKVAPEHSEDKVLSLMRKSSFQLFVKLKELFDAETLREQMPLQLIPYFMSSHPGCGSEEMKGLQQKVRKMGYRLEQVQDFTPTPMTLSSVMFYTGINPYTRKKIFVERILSKKKQQFSKFFG